MLLNRIKTKLDLITIVLICMFIIFFIKFLNSFIDIKEKYETSKKQLDILMIDKICVDENGISVCYDIIPNLYKIIVVKEKAQESINTVIFTRK